MFEPAAAGIYPNYKQFVKTNSKARIFYEESRKIKKHDDYYYRPLRFRHQIIGFYGYVLPEQGKTSFTERDFKIMDMMEPVFNSGIMQAVLTEKERFQDNLINGGSEYSILYLYPNNAIEIPLHTNEKLICDILRIDKIHSEAIFSHPLIKKLLELQIVPGQNVVMNSLRIERDGMTYTVGVLLNKYTQRHGHRFLKMICFEKDKELFSFTRFALQMHLTKRETELVNALVKGMSNKQISEVLFISEATVKKHLVNIYEKTGSKNRTQLVLSLTSF